MQVKNAKAVSEVTATSHTWSYLW